MPAATTTVIAEEDLYAWRLDQLLRLNIPWERAELLAGRFDIELNRARELHDQGCPPELIVRILW